VNGPLVHLHPKNTNNAKSEVTFKQLICNPFRGAFTIDSSTPTLRLNLNEHPIEHFNVPESFENETEMKVANEWLEAEKGLNFPSIM
jgi:hypothetical protein